MSDDGPAGMELKEVRRITAAGHGGLKATCRSYTGSETMVRLGGFRRFALLGSAGMVAWRWWKNRQANRVAARRVPIERDVRQSYDTGHAS
jgi:hypothetical protein